MKIYITQIESFVIAANMPHGMVKQMPTACMLVKKKIYKSAKRQKGERVKLNSAITAIC